MDKSELYVNKSWWNFKILMIKEKMLQSSDEDKIDYLQRNENQGNRVFISNTGS